MTYRIVVYPDAQDQLQALPSELLPHYAEVAKVMALVPWNGRPYNADKPDGIMREMVFGPGGSGTVTYMILEDQRRVDVLIVQWFG